MKDKKTWLSGPYIVWIILFTVVPVIILFYYAFQDDAGRVTIDYFKGAVRPIHLKALGLSVLLSLMCTVVCLLLAYPLALCMRYLKMGKKGMMIAIVIGPMWMNYVLRIMSWQLILSQNGVLNKLLSILHLPHQDWGNSATAIVIGMIYDYLPFMLLPVYNAVMDIGEDVIEAAHDLGASKATVLRKVMIPLSKPGIISGITMVFIPALTTFAISDMLGGGKVMLIGNIIEQEFISSMNWHLGAALSLLLMLFIIPGIIFSNEEEGGF